MESLSEQAKSLTKEECLKMLPWNYAFHREPYLHQLQALLWSITRNNPAFFMQMGTGKSATAIEWLRWNNIDRRILVVTVNEPLAENWRNEFAMNYPSLEGIVLMGTAKERKFLLSNELDYYVINFEGIRVIWDELNEKKWDAIIIDESRRLLNPKAIRTQLCVELGKKIEYRTILSGLPTVSPLDIFGQYLFLDRGETFGKNFYKFRRSYFNEIRKGRFSTWVIRRDTENQLYKLIDSLCFRVDKAECLDLPEKIYKTLNTRLASDQQKDYLSLAEGDGSLSIAKLTKEQLDNCFIKYSQITGGFIKDSKGNYQYYPENPKISTLLDIIHDSMDATKIIVFHRFVAEGRLIEEALRKHKIKFASMRSEIKHTNEEAKRFQNDDRVRVLVAHPLSGGIGLNFIQSSLTVYYSLDWNSEFYLQSQDRTHRIGQDKSPTYIHLLAKGTLDEEIWKAHKENLSLIDRMKRYKLSIKDVLFGKGEAWKEEY